MIMLSNYKEIDAKIFLEGSSYEVFKNFVTTVSLLLIAISNLSIVIFL